MDICRFVMGFTYYGISMHTGDLGGNPYVTFILSALVEFPSYLLAMWLFKSYGRWVALLDCLFISLFVIFRRFYRRTYNVNFTYSVPPFAYGFIVGGIALIASIFVPEGKCHSVYLIS